MYYIETNRRTTLMMNATTRRGVTTFESDCGVLLLVSFVFFDFFGFSLFATGVLALTGVLFDGFGVLGSALTGEDIVTWVWACACFLHRVAVVVTLN